MLKLIYGVPGSGKTYTVDTMILEYLKNRKSVTLLVPEQEVMEAERRIADRAEAEGIFCETLTVVSFRRLSDIASRKYGGIEYKNMGDGGRLIVIWRIIEELTQMLKAYRSKRDRALCELMLSVCNELKRYRVSPLSVSKAADANNGTKLGDKLSDISIIYSAYLTQMKYEYSDSIDCVDRLSDILKSHDFLSDTALFADSFNGFTSNELRVLEYAMTMCDVTVTLCRPEENGKIAFRTVEKTEKQLISRAERHNVKIDKPIRLESDSKYISSYLKLIENHLWDFSYNSPQDKKSDAVSLVFCSDRFFEAEYIASRICNLVRDGARYKDIAVIGRDTEKYESVFALVFEKYEIPFFFSHRSKLTSSAFYRAISGALDIISGGFASDDILSYIKTGCVGLNESEINLIESYVLRWNLSGKAWTDSYAWNMNPLGFSEREPKLKAELTEKINALRIKIREPLIKLRDSLKGGCTVKDGVKAIYTFVLECGLYDIASSGKNRENVTVYNTIINLLDTLNEVGGDIPADVNVMRELLLMAAKNTDFGRIPQSFDCVLAGDAAIMRASGRDHIFLTGCENGVFPKAVADDSFFTDSDKAILLSNGIELSSDTTEKNDDEMFYFLRAALSASKSLTATSVLSNGKFLPSSGFTRLCKLFPANCGLFPENKQKFPASEGLPIYPKDFSDEYRIQTLSGALDIVSPSKSSALYSAVQKIYSENGIPLPSHRIPLFETNIKLSEDTADMLFGKKFGMSQSRFEDYAKCPFSYYSKHILKLSEQEYSNFRSSDIGSFIHKILERVISYIFPRSGGRKYLTDKELRELIERETNDVLEKYLGENYTQSGRISALLSRLTRTVTFLINNLLDEFSHSKFVPRFFELPIGGQDGSVNPLSITLDNGNRLSVYGSIDRVDTYLKDGDAYVRVLDYKTGGSLPSLNKISDGLGLQMYLYLFAICSSSSNSLKNEIGISAEGRLLPAGIMYHRSRITAKSCNRPESTERALALATGELVRSGVLLKDEEILNAMEEGLEGKYIAVKKEKDKISAKKSGELLTLDEFGKLYEDIISVMKDIGGKIRSGCADVSPNEDVSPCKYCKMMPFCRKTN